MKNRFLHISILLMLLNTLFACNKTTKKSNDDSKVVKDTVLVSTAENDACYTYNLPCKVINIHTELPGKAMLVFWLHGGVNDQKWHNFYKENHMTWVNADDSIASYLKKSGKKAVFLIPLCHKADIPHCIKWIDCADDIRGMIDDYVQNGVVDKNRVYVIGSSDGGAGTWDLISSYGDWFAAAMPLSCSVAKKTDIPVYWHSTSSEGDQSAQANSLNAQGCHIVYEYHPNVKHGGDEEACDKSHLDRLFGHVRNSKTK